MPVLLETFTDDRWQALAERELILYVAALLRVPDLRDQSHNPQDSHNQAPHMHTPDATQPPTGRRGAAFARWGNDLRVARVCVCSRDSNQSG